MTARSSRSEPLGAVLPPSEALPNGFGCPADSGRENALERAAALARARLVEGEAKAQRLVIELRERAGDASALLDPETQALRREWEENEYVARQARAAQRAAGSSNGPRRQCAGCKTFLGSGAFQCPSCGYLDGAGYLPVPSKVSIYERWR